MSYATPSAPSGGGYGLDPPPPSYAQVANTKVTYIDFIPRCLESAGLFTMPTYQQFDVLVVQANAWLSSHAQWKVISCESIESKLKSDGAGSADTSKSSYTVHGEANTIYNRSLRLWVCNKTPADNPEPQQLGYYNVIPKPTAEGFSRPDFESFNETIHRINTSIARNPIQGRIINMETQAMKFKSWDKSVHADKCVWKEYGKADVYFLNIVRIFFEKGIGQITKIGVKDFVPAFNGVRYEPFRVAMVKANSWIDHQGTGINVCNVQSVNYKVAGGAAGGTVNTTKPLYCEHGNVNTKYLRIVRVYYTEGIDYSQVTRQTPLQVTYRTFLPFEHGHMDYEAQPSVAKRMLAFINATGAKVMSCETLKVRIMDGRQQGNPEVTYTSADRHDSRYLLVLRLYLDGAVRDPPPGTLAEAPRPQNYTQEDCCVIL